MSLAKVEGFSNLRKDTSSGGVVNVDKKAYELHHAKRMKDRASQDKMSTLQNEINTMKSDISNIKDMLTQLLQKGN